MMFSSWVRCLFLVAPALAAFSPLLPEPQSSTLGDNILTISADFKFAVDSSQQNSSLLQLATERYTKLIAAPAATFAETGVLSSCSVASIDVEEGEILGSDESYKLSISSIGECSISAQTVWGLLRGMETFTQLLVRDAASNSVTMNYSPVSINDKNRFNHRGILIDSARHYLPISAILTVIDTFPMNKFNVLHWHIVDAESFPLNSTSEPTMVNGAYSGDMTYSLEEMAAVKMYARERGVEIIVELDVPGHAAGWIKGKPEIMADCLEKYSYNINDYALDVSMEETYTTIEGILTDVAQAMGSTHLHIGGDEVIYGCWKEDADITTFMADNGIAGDYDALLAYFVSRADGIVNSLGAKAIHWEEVFSAGCEVSEGTVFQVWTDSSMMSAVTAANYPVISSPSNYWYLNILTNTWMSMYEYDPCVGLSTEQCALVVGGEAALWGEYVDEVNIVPTLYPRASSVAERLWSAKTVVDTDDHETRLMIQRCRMVARGYNAAPVKPSYCPISYV